MKKVLYFAILMLWLPPISSAQDDSGIVLQPPKRDAGGDLLPCMPYQEFITRGMKFLLDDQDKWYKGERLKDEAGKPLPGYFLHAKLRPNGSPYTKPVIDRGVVYPAGHHSFDIQCFLSYYEYAGDERALASAKQLADWNIAHSTPMDWLYGGLPYSTFVNGVPGGFVDGDAIMTDKPAIMALAYIRLTRVTGEDKYLQAARVIADTLAKNQSEAGNWPFRVNPQTGEVQEEYTSSIIYAIKLFEQLDLQDGTRRYQQNRMRALKWLKENPLKTMLWLGFYEDVGNSPENRTNWDCIDTISYILAHPWLFPDSLATVQKLNNWIDENFIEHNHAYSPADGVREQKVCFNIMGGHCIHWAAMMGDLYNVTHDEAVKKRVIQAANFLTYHLQPDNRIIVGPEHGLKHPQGAPYWYSCQFSSIYHLLEIMRMFPELDPAASKDSRQASVDNDLMYMYTYVGGRGKVAYDEAMAVACIQGIINRERPCLYVVPANKKSRPYYWLDILSRKDGWLPQKKRVAIDDLDSLVKFAGDKLKGAVIWDPKVPATCNVATTIAGVKDGIVLSPELAEEKLTSWKLPVIDDLRGRFDGSLTGSKKNDAYRWAINEYLAKGRCSSHLLCLFEDSARARDIGDIGYVVTRDWAVMKRSFGFDLSPWSDEQPKDEPNQPLGSDLETYKMILAEVLRHSAGKHMTELAGFFAFWKYCNQPDYPSKHLDVPTEWETVYLISPYNCYQNTVASSCYNQSFHSQAPFTPLKQARPVMKDKVEDKSYIAVLMADYDSATPLYDFLPKFWDDAGRGKLPLAWGINPNLIETFPDIISYLYQTATKNDFFTSDASCAGYMNPNRIAPEYLDLFIKHNQKFFQAADMSIAPMVLDWDEPTAAVKDAFVQFAPDGFATIVLDYHNKGGHVPRPHVWKGMPVMELYNDTCISHSPEQTAAAMFQVISRQKARPAFCFFRIVWTTPSRVVDSVHLLEKEHPELKVEVVDPYNFFALFRKSQQISPGPKE